MENAHYVKNNIMSISKFRGILYTVAKYLGDVQAVSSVSTTKIKKRVVRRVAGKYASRGIGSIIAKLFK